MGIRDKGPVILFGLCGMEGVCWVYFIIIDKPRHINLPREEVFHIAGQGDHIFPSMFYRRQHKHCGTLNLTSCRYDTTVRRYNGTDRLFDDIIMETALPTLLS